MTTLTEPSLAEPSLAAAVRRRVRVRAARRGELSSSCHTYTTPQPPKS